MRTIELTLPLLVTHKPISDSQWRAAIYINGKHVYLGYFNEDDEEAAARAYDEAARNVGRPTNFSDKKRTRSAKAGERAEADKRQRMGQPSSSSSSSPPPPAARQSKYKGVHWNKR